jgi:hypothetical protein
MKICVFDVNETLLDLRAMDEDFAKVFGDIRSRQEWFSQCQKADQEIYGAGRAVRPVFCDTLQRFM